VIAVPRRGLVLAVAILLGALAVGSLVGLATSTETRYAEMGREMAASGDLVVPRFGGAPRLEKPPFDAWSTAAALALLGASDVAARVPHLLAGLLTLLVVAAAVRRLAPSREEARDRARLALLAVGTMPAFVLQAYTVSTDAWLVLSTTLSGWALLEGDRAAGKPPLRFVLLLHGAMAWGMLVKGPLAIGLPLGAAAATALVRRDARILRPFVQPLGLAVLLAVSAPWYALVESRLPGTLEALFRRRLLGTFAGSEVGHARGPLTVWGPVAGAFPWLAAVPAAVRGLRAEGRWKAGPGLPIAALALAAPVLFTFSSNRLPSYASPAMPWIGVLVALGAQAAGGPALRALVRASVAVAAVAVGVAGLATVLAFVPPIVSVVHVACGAIAVVAATTALVVVVRRRNLLDRAVASASLAAVALLVALGSAATVSAESLKAARPLAGAIAKERRAGEPVAAWLHANGDWGLLPFYLRDDVVFFDFPSKSLVVRPEDHRPDHFRPESDVVPWLRAHPGAWLLVRPKDAAALEGTGLTLRRVLRWSDYEAVQVGGGAPADAR